MEFDLPIIIASDLHLSHPATYLKDCEQLAPIVRDAATVIFNGDSVESLWARKRDQAQTDLARMATLCAAERSQLVFINGNHDPFISDYNHLDLSNGEILMTHGDILFHDITPWSNKAALLGPEHSRLLNEMSRNGVPEFERRLKANKRASLILEKHDSILPIHKMAWFRKLQREIWPPWRLRGLFQVWKETPGRAAAVADQYRPAARFVIIGHTHRAGVWHIGNRIIINTGSFMPLSGRIAVIIEKHSLEVRKIHYQLNRFTLGRAIKTFRLHHKGAGVEVV